MGGHTASRRDTLLVVMTTPQCGVRTDVSSEYDIIPTSEIFTLVHVANDTRQ